MKFAAIRRTSDNRVILSRVRWCDSFFCKLRGLTFRRRLGMEDALVLVESADSTGGSSIHMMFVFFSIAVIWIDSNGRVVDCRVAKPFRPMYTSHRPARYVLEGPPRLLEILTRGDEIQFEPVAD